MVDYMSPIYWLFLTLSALSLPLLRRKRPDAARPYRVPFGPVLPLVFAGMAVYILWASVLYVGWIGTTISFGVLAAGLLLRALVLAKARGQGGVEAD
jgi:amino acid transporter